METEENWYRSRREEIQTFKETLSFWEAMVDDIYTRKNQRNLSHSILKLRGRNVDLKLQDEEEKNEKATEGELRNKIKKDEAELNYKMQSRVLLTHSEVHSRAQANLKIQALQQKLDLQQKLEKEKREEQRKVQEKKQQQQKQEQEIEEKRRQLLKLVQKQQELFKEQDLLLREKEKEQRINREKEEEKRRVDRIFVQIKQREQRNQEEQKQRNQEKEKQRNQAREKRQEKEKEKDDIEAQIRQNQPTSQSYIANPYGIETIAYPFSQQLVRTGPLKIEWFQVEQQIGKHHLKLCFPVDCSKTCLQNILDMWKKSWTCYQTITITSNELKNSEKENGLKKQEKEDESLKISKIQIVCVQKTKTNTTNTQDYFQVGGLEISDFFELNQSIDSLFLSKITRSNPNFDMNTFTTVGPFFITFI